MANSGKSFLRDIPTSTASTITFPPVACTARKWCFIVTGSWIRRTASGLGGDPGRNQALYWLTENATVGP